jgi:hypothetical protein
VPPPENQAAKEESKHLQMSTKFMDTQDRTQKKSETKFAEKLIYALNYIKMQVEMYPEGHRMISHGLDIVSDVLQEIFALKGQITINVKDDALYVGEDILDNKSRNNEQFAKWFNDLYLTSITLSKGLTRDDLLKFLNIIAMKTSDIMVAGNIEKLFAEKRIAHIKVKGFDLSSLVSRDMKIPERERLKNIKKTEAQIADPEKSEDNKSFEEESWQKFIHSLIAESIGEEEQKSRFPKSFNIDSQNFIKRLNEETIDWDVFLNHYRSMITQYFHSEDEREKSTSEKIIFRIDNLVKNFHSQLKQKVFSITEKEISLLSPSIIKSDKLNGLGYEMITEMLRRASNEKRGMSPSLSLLFQTLSKTYDRLSDGSEKDVLNGSSLIDEIPISAKDIEKLIEREHFESYVPADYEELLRRQTMLIADDKKMNVEGFIIENHIGSLEDENLNFQISRLFLAIMDEDLNEDEYQEISIYITQGISEFISLGYFSFLIDVLDTYRKHAREKHSKKIQNLADSGIKIICNTNNLLQDLKPFFRQGISMNSLIDFVVACGAQNIPWLLDLYMETHSPKGQAMLVEVLRHFREEAASNVLKRLPETSTHFIKKFLILLQLIGNADVVPYIKTFVSHPDLTIKLEAIRTLLRFKDPDAKVLLQEAVFSKDPSESAQAIVLAYDYRIMDLCVKLIALIKTVMISNQDLEFNEFIITEAVKTRDPQILPYLEKMAGTRWSLSPGRLFLTKMALLNAISLYAPPNAIKLIRMCLSSGNKQIKALCSELMKGERK